MHLQPVDALSTASRPPPKTPRRKPLLAQPKALTGIHSETNYPAPLRRIKYRDAETGNTYVFLTNNFLLSALTIAKLYKARWQVELTLSPLSRQKNQLLKIEPTSGAVDCSAPRGGQSTLCRAHAAPRFRLPTSPYTTAGVRYASAW